jgi:glutathione S-transferase
MTIAFTAFEKSPDRGKGLGRDMCFRWALEEVGQPHDVRLVSIGPAFRAMHPFGQIRT